MYLHVCVCVRIGVYVPNVCRGLQSLRLRPHGTEITGGCTPAGVGTRTRTQEGQEALLTTELPLPPNAWGFHLSTENQTQLALYRTKLL